MLRMETDYALAGDLVASHRCCADRLCIVASGVVSVHLPGRGREGDPGGLLMRLRKGSAPPSPMAMST